MISLEIANRNYFFLLPFSYNISNIPTLAIHKNLERQLTTRETWLFSLATNGYATQQQIPRFWILGSYLSCKGCYCHHTKIETIILRLLFSLASESK